MTVTTFHFPWYGGGGSIEVEGTYGGAAVATRPTPHTVSLNGREYGVELVGPDGRQLYQRRSLDRQSQGIVQSDQPDDSQFNDAGAWFRYVTSWHEGAGQIVQDFGEDWSPRRFYNSLGVDPWEKWCLKLLPSTSRLRTPTSTNIYLVATGTYVYYSDGSDVYYSSDLSAWTQVTGLAGTIQDLAVDGSTVYIATSSHIYTRADSAGGAAATTFTTTGDSYDKVAFVGNRLLAAVANVLYEIDSLGGRTAFETHYQAAFRWTAIFSIGSRIYIGGYAGNRTEIYTATVTSTGSLVRSAEAAPFPAGELLNDAISYGGQVVLATSLGVRLAALSGDGALSYGPLIEAPGDCKSLWAEGRFVWFGWTGITSGGSGVGRLALDELVDTLQPAYATDVYTTLDSDTVTAVCRFNGRTLFAISEDGVYAADAAGNYVSSGYVESGQVFLGTVEPKALVSANVRTDLLASGESITLDVTDERADNLGTFAASAGAYGLDASLVQPTDDGTQVQWVRLKLTLNGGGSSTPCARSWRLRGFPVIPLTHEWIVPLIIHAQNVHNDADGQIVSLDQLAEVEYLIDLAEASAVIPFREGERTHRVRIEQYEYNPKEWDDSSDFFDGIFIARLMSA